MQDDVDRLLGWREADGAQNGFRVLDADAPAHGHAENAGALLAVDHDDDTRLARVLDAADGRATLLLEAPAAEQLRCYDEQHHEQQCEPERRTSEVGDAHGPGTLLVFHRP